LFPSIVTLGDVGVGVSKFEIRRIVQNYLKMTNQSSVFKEGIPGKKWLKLFLNRWKKELSERTPQNLPKSRGAAVTRECVDDFYGMVEKKFKVQIYGVIPPTSIFNCDEVGFSCSQGEKKIICRRGT
jgi:hypothetical protein